MHFEPSYFIEETREGFYIPPMMKRCWAAQLDALEQVRIICDRHYIKWFADCGTLMGAVRHGGYIPWDDDLDICMLRDDYEKFKKYAEKELPNNYLLRDRDYEENYDNFLLRVVSNNSISIKNDYLLNNHGFPYAAGLDIFPFDYLSEDIEWEKTRQKKLNKLWNIAEEIRALDDDAAKEKYSELIENISGYSLSNQHTVFNGLMRIMDQIFTECDGKKSTRCAFMRYYMTNNDHIYPLDCYKEYITVPYETTDIRIPVGYNEILKLEYGAWYKINRKCAGHGYPYYSEMEQVLFDERKYIPYRYYYRPDDSICKGRSEHWASVDVNNQIVKMLEDVVSVIISVIDGDDEQSAYNLLMQAQELAIKLGNSVEEQYGDIPTIISLLEKYCERIYSIYVKLHSGESINTYQEQKRLLKLTDNLNRAYRSGLPRKKQVVFMPAVPTNWQYMVNYYDEMASDDNNIVQVMPIPYAGRADDGSLIGEYIAHVGEYPKELSLIDYRMYDFKHNHPDIIVIQEGWDEFSSGMIVHPFFYATNIRKYTEHLVFIPPYRLDEFDRSDDQRSFDNMMYTAIKPGVICADEVILGSEKIKDYCVEWLTVGTDIKDSFYWSEKITVIDNRAKNSESSSQNGDRKKLLFYYSCSDIYTYREKAIDKLNSIIDTFIASKDKIEVIWYSEPDYNDNLKKISPDVYNRYLDQIKRFIDLQLGTRISKDELSHILDSVDAFYGSAGRVQNLCVYHEKPVMIVSCDDNQI